MKIIFVSLICTIFAKPQGLGFNPVLSNPSSNSDGTEPLESSSDDVSIIPFSDGNRTSSDHILFLTNFKPATSNSNVPTVQQIRNNQPAGIVPQDQVVNDETSGNTSSQIFLRQPFRPSPEIPSHIFNSDTEDSQFHVRQTRQIQGSVSPVFSSIPQENNSGDLGFVSSANRSTVNNIVRQPLRPSIQSLPIQPVTVDSQLKLRNARQVQGSFTSFTPTSANRSTVLSPARKPLNPKPQSIQPVSGDSQLNLRNTRQVQGSFAPLTPSSANRTNSNVFNPVRHSLNSNIQRQPIQPVAGESQIKFRNARQAQGAFATFDPTSDNTSTVLIPARSPLSPIQTQPLSADSQLKLRNARQVQGSFAPTSIKTEGNFNRDSLVSTVRHPLNPSIQNQPIQPASGDNQPKLRNARQAQGSFTSFTSTNIEKDSPFDNSANNSTFDSVVRQPLNPINHNAFQPVSGGSQLNLRNTRQVQGSFASFTPDETADANDSPFLTPTNRSTVISIVRQPLNPIFQSGSSQPLADGSQLNIRNTRQAESPEQDFDSFDSQGDFEEEDEESHVDTGDQETFPQSFDSFSPDQSFQPESEESDSGVGTFPNTQGFSSQENFPVFQNPSATENVEEIEKRQISFPSDVSFTTNTSKPTSSLFN